MDIHGAPLEQTWVKLPYQTAKVGEGRIVMPDPLPGWKEGDRIILTGTTRQFGYIGTRHRRGGDDNSVADNPTTEERVITRMRHFGGLDSKLQIASGNVETKGHTLHYHLPGDAAKSTTKSQVTAAHAGH